MRIDQEVATVFLDDGPAAILAHRIASDGAEITANGPRSRNADQAEMALADQIPGKWHDDFGWQRDARALNRHQERDAGITKRDDDRRGETGQPSDDMFDHCAHCRGR